MADDFEDLLTAYELRASLQNADWDLKVCRAWRVVGPSFTLKSHSEDSKDIACIIPSLCHQTCMCSTSAVLGINFWG